jgi:hypothetical protein
LSPQKSLLFSSLPFFAKWSKGTPFSEMGVFCEKFLLLKKMFPKLRHLTKKTAACSEATFWACSDVFRSNFHAGNRNKRDAGFLLRIL